MRKYDFTVIGGGLVGLATAYSILRKFPSKSLLLLEKERTLTAHQSGRNSGVIHSGIYYQPGSLKAKNCRYGKELLIKFAEEAGVPYKICGKVIVASNENELSGLNKIYQRGLANGVDCELIGPERLRELEPHAFALQAIWVKEAGVIDYKFLGQALAAKLEALGAEIRLNSSVNSILENSDQSVISFADQEIVTNQIINAAGLYSDRVLGLAAKELRVNRIVPFRGEYYTLKSEKSYLCKTLIYPVPNPEFPFLGVHFTRDVYGEVECGPNAVLALAREGYSWRDINLKDISETFFYSGFWKFSRKYWKEGLAEILRSFSKRKFVESLATLIPEICLEDLVVGQRGVRAQAMVPSGSLVDDFLIQRSKRGVHILNAPSPAATSCLSIGESVAQLIDK